jgi:hypothetical protein
MRFNILASLAGIGFVLAALAVNFVYVRAGLPLPTSGENLLEVTDSYAALADALKGPSVIAPALWLCTTLFAAGLLSMSWRTGSEERAWALVGFAGILLQNATFTSVEALRFGMATAAIHDPGSVSGLWGLSNVLFGFNQVFLAMAMLGFTIAGVRAKRIPGWHAVLGYVGAALLFTSSLASPYNVDGANPLGPLGLIGWFLWATWIVAYSITLLRHQRQDSSDEADDGPLTATPRPSE